MSTCRKLLLLSLLLWGSLLIGERSALAQQPVIHYVYDDLGRLIAVVDPEGNSATYTYDAVGNLLAIQRVNASDIPGPVAITLVSPNKGAVGTQVQIFGKGFSPTAGENTVSFSGAVAVVTASTANSISTSVPPGAVTGLITVTTPLGSAVSPTPFTVLGAITVTPTTVTLPVNGTQQFQAQEAGVPTTNVNWAVNGITGGDQVVGTITTEGLYTAPATAPVPPTVTVTATHKDDPTLKGSATVTILTPQPVFIASAAVSVTVTIPLTVDKNVISSVSVRVAESGATFLAAPAVSVVLESVGLTFMAAPATSVSLQPVITQVAPSAAPRGSAGLLVTLTGAGFTGATDVVFLLNNAIDPNFTVSSLTVDGTGTQATLEISIASNAALGARVVQIITPAGSSTRAGTGGNLFTVE